jgi:hypothetical protein
MHGVITANHGGARAEQERGALWRARGARLQMAAAMPLASIGQPGTGNYHLLPFITHTRGRENAFFMCDVV